MNITQFKTLLALSLPFPTHFVSLLFLFPNSLSPLIFSVSLFPLLTMSPSPLSVTLYFPCFLRCLCLHPFPSLLSVSHSPSFSFYSPSHCLSTLSSPLPSLCLFLLFLVLSHVSVSSLSLCPSSLSVSTISISPLIFVFLTPLLSFSVSLYYFWLAPLSHFFAYSVTLLSFSLSSSIFLHPPLSLSSFLVRLRFPTLYLCLVINKCLPGICLCVMFSSDILP